MRGTWIRNCRPYDTGRSPHATQITRTRRGGDTDGGGLFTACAAAGTHAGTLNDRTAGLFTAEGAETAEIPFLSLIGGHDT